MYSLAGFFGASGQTPSRPGREVAKTVGVVTGHLR